jgi:hypothetical protein
MKRFPGVMVWIGTVREKGKELSRFISRKVPKPYFAIRLDDRSLIIAVKCFDGGTRRNKKKFIDHDLPGILKTLREGRALSSSRMDNAREKIKSPPFYARVNGDKVREYKRLKTAKERADWLRSQKEMWLWNNGEKLLEANP